MEFLRDGKLLNYMLSDIYFCCFSLKLRWKRSRPLLYMIKIRIVLFFIQMPVDFDITRFHGACIH